MSEGAEHRAAEATLLTLRASLADRSILRGYRYVLLPDDKELTTEQAVAALVALPKRLLCSATLANGAMVIRFHPMAPSEGAMRKAPPPGALDDLAEYIREAYGVEDEILVLLRGGGETMRLSEGELRQWQHDYVIINSSLSVGRPDAEAKRQGVTAVIMVGRSKLGSQLTGLLSFP